MIDGTFTYYTLQHKLIGKTDWLKPSGELIPVKNTEWSFSNWDTFGSFAEPWAGSGNDYKPLFRKSYEETHDVWSKTRNRGWWSPLYAVKGLRRVRAASEAMKLVVKDGYNQVCQIRQYEFQIVKVTVSKKVEIPTLEDIAN